MSKLLFTSYSPNTRAKDLIANFLLFLTPWKLIKGRDIDLVTNWYEEHFNTKAFTFLHARSGMYVLFKSLGLKPNDEIIMQGFTCVAAVNPILKAGVKVIYADINEQTLNFDLQKLEQKISPKTKAIIFQHTFGNSSGIEEVKKLCQKRNILLIEDCANTILGTHNGQLIGTFGDAAIFSMGKDKPVSGINGGVITINNEKLLKNFEKLYVKIEYPNFFWVLKELFQPAIWYLVRSLYTIKLGKLIHLVGMKLGLITRATTIEEKNGHLPDSFIKRMPNAFARLAYTQLSDLAEINTHRGEIALIYDRIFDTKRNLKKINFQHGNIPLRYPLIVDNAHKFRVYLIKHNIQVGDWFDKPVAPKEVILEKVNYIKGMCPTVENISEKIINLPTHIHITEDDATKIANTILTFYE